MVETVFSQNDPRQAGIGATGQAPIYEDAKFSWLAPIGLLLLPVQFLLGIGLTGFLILAFVIGFENALQFVWTVLAITFVWLAPTVPIYWVGYFIRWGLKVQRWFPALGGLLANCYSLAVIALALNKLGSGFGWDWAIWLTGGLLLYGLRFLWLLAFLGGLFGAYSERRAVASRS